MSYENYAPPRSAVDGPIEEDAGANPPALWIPSTTANICLLFPIALGAWLQQRNWEALGRPAEARKARFWMIADLFFVAAWVVVPRLGPAFSGIMSLTSFVMLVSWYYSSAKPQYVYVKKTYGKNYPRRSWAMPLLIGIAADVAIVVIQRLV
ncbi:MAG: hypothetical protein ACTHL8_18225 [Burkholderiaceae bacterium]